MKTLNELLDLAKERNNLTSDRKLSEALDVGNMVRYRKGNDTPSDGVAIRLARLCDMSPEVVISICHSFRAKTDAERKIWGKIYNLTKAASNIYQAGDEKKISDRIAA